MWLVVSDFVLCGFSKHSHLEQISCYDYPRSRLCVGIVATWQILKKLYPYIRSAALDHGLIVFPGSKVHCTMDYCNLNFLVTF